MSPTVQQARQLRCRKFFPGFFCIAQASTRPQWQRNASENRKNNDMIVINVICKMDVCWFFPPILNLTIDLQVSSCSRIKRFIVNPLVSQTPGLPALSLQWGPWAEVGTMASNKLLKARCGPPNSPSVYGLRNYFF